MGSTCFQCTQLLTPVFIHIKFFKMYCNMSKSQHLWSLGFLLKNAVNCRLSNEDGVGKDRRHLEKTGTLFGASVATCMQVLLRMLCIL